MGDRHQGRECFRWWIWLGTIPVGFRIKYLTIFLIYFFSLFSPFFLAFFVNSIYFIITILYSFKKRKKRVGGHYWRIVLHTGTGEKENPVLPMGRRKKIPCRPPPSLVFSGEWRRSARKFLRIGYFIIFSCLDLMIWEEKIKTVNKLQKKSYML